MFSFLGMINGWLGYVNMNAKVKNRIYTILGFIGNLYLLYVAYRFFLNGFMGRGCLFILAFLGLLYFCYLNFLYYFTTKSSRIDISPFLDEKLHLHLKEPTDKKAEDKLGYIQTNGLFAGQQLLPGTVEMTATEEANLQAIVNQLVEVDYLTLDFNQVTDQQIIKAAKQEPDKNYPALVEPVALPYFELAPVAGKLMIYGGVNQIEKKVVGQLTSVGLMPAIEAKQKYYLSLATVVITGGPYKYKGRTTVLTQMAPYKLAVQVAYQAKD